MKEDIQMANKQENTPNTTNHKKIQGFPDGIVARLCVPNRGAPSSIFIRGIRSKNETKRPGENK